MYRILLFLNCLLLVLCSNECGFQSVVCEVNSQYRTIEGHCNNLGNPSWGSIYSCYDRILGPKYGDGVHSFPTALSGEDLPNPREMTTTIYTDGEVETVSEFNLNVMQYGQLLTHDMSLTYFTLTGTACCTRELQFLDPLDAPKVCAPIPIPENDPYYSFINATCIAMERTQTNKDLGCSSWLTYEEQISRVNSYIDLSMIYGQTNEEHKSLRSFQNGTLLVEKRKNFEWFPSTKNIEGYCIGNLNSKERCYYSGDIRNNQNPQLLVLVLVWFRNHNRIARKLQEINPHWDDERIFQEARRINIAKHQYISYYQLLPIYLGKVNLLLRGILYNTEGFVNDYDDKMRPHVYNEHAQAAFKQFHSLIAGKLQMFNPSGCPYDSLELRDYFLRPNFLEEHKIYDGLIRGLALQSQMASDRFYDPTFTRYAFLKFMRFGLDIKSIDIHRSRDHGLASYNDMRYYCGMKKATSFSDFLDVMSQSNVALLELFYKTPGDVDLIVGGSLEDNLPGTLSGPTFACIMYLQFYRTRRSDRFWFENKSSGLTLAQLKEIRKMSVARLLCDNGNDIKYMQLNAFRTVSLKNPRIPCIFIMEPNLDLWKESIRG